MKVIVGPAMLTPLTSSALKEGPMNSERTTLQSLTARLWRSDKPLTAAGLLMLAALAAFSVGLSSIRARSAEHPHG